MNRVKPSVILILAILIISLLLSKNSAPNNPVLFPLKRIQEKLFSNLNQTPSAEAYYQLKLLDARLYEVDKVITDEDYFYLLESSLRYSTSAGKIVELINSNHLDGQREAARNLFLLHQEKLKQSLNSYPKDLNEESKYIQDDINYLKIYLTQL